MRDARDAFHSNKFCRGVWVPAFAGTTAGGCCGTL